MILRNIILVFLLYKVSYSFSQYKVTSYQFPEKFNKSYFFDPEQSYKKIKDYQINGISKEEMNLFKIQSTYNIQRDFNNNSFYLEWYDLENYLDKLISNILPEDLKSKQKFVAFIKRNPDFKIEVLGNGFIFLNIGFLSTCKNETELSYLLAHHIYHTFYDRIGMEIKMELNELNNGKPKDIKYVDKKISSILIKNDIQEMRADSFAYDCIIKSGQKLHNLDNILNILQFIESKSLNLYSREYHIKTKQLTPSLINKDTIIGRQAYLQNFVKNNNINSRNYLVDSLYFNKIKKTAREECKKISSENGNYETTLKLSFVDYLLGDGTPKNLFHIIESTRRLIYREPELLKKGFLAEDLQFTEFKNTNFSILKKPEYLFIDSSQYNKAKKHPLLNQNNSFNTYEEAFWYFIKEAESKNLNEIEFSKALFYYSQKDESNFLTSLNNYIKKGGGVYTDFSENLLKFKMPYINEGKILVIIDNTTNEYRDNYYQSIDRKKYNTDISQQFKLDSLKIKLSILNEYEGFYPKTLNQYQKICNSLTKLYDKNEFEIFSKRKYLGKESMEEREKRNKFNKNIFIYNPDLFKWFLEEHFTGVFLQKIHYEYTLETDTEEIFNRYSIYYCNAFDNRPFFWTSTRNNNIKKQQTKDMIKEGRDYLFYKE